MVKIFEDGETFIGFIYSRHCKGKINSTIVVIYWLVNKRPMRPNGQLSNRDSTLTSCQKGSYLQIYKQRHDKIKRNEL